MLKHYWVAFFVMVSWVVRVIDASAGDADPHYRACLQECEETGCVAQRCFPHCNFSSGGGSMDGQWFLQEPLYLQWKQWDCQGNCRYYCMVDREKEREAAGYGPVKYHGKWPFKRVYGIQEPASVAFSLLNLAMHFHGWVSLLILLFCKLPLRRDKKAYYDYASLWHIYGLLSLNSWFWSAVFHSSGNYWVLAYSCHTQKFKREGRCCQSYGCCSTACFCNYPHIVSQLL